MDTRGLLMAFAAISGIVGLAVPWLGGADDRFRWAEMRAKQTVGAIHAAEEQYCSQFGRYAGTLYELGLPLSDLGEQGNYRFRVSRTDRGYAITAEPVQCGMSGSRSYYSDQTIVIHQYACAAPVR